MLGMLSSEARLLAVSDMSVSKQSELESTLPMLSMLGVGVARQAAC
jgi:hypothetical protein